MGFEVLTARKGIFIDGHERPDVVSSCMTSLRKMVKIGSVQFTNALMEEARQALHEDMDPPILETRKKTVVFFHDETTFQSTEDQPMQWGLKGTKPKSKGAGIRVSGFIDEHNGFLALTDEECECRSNYCSRTSANFCAIIACGRAFPFTRRRNGCPKKAC